MPLTGWISPAQIAADTQALQQAMMAHPERWPQWWSVRSVEQARDCLMGLDLEAHHKKRLLGQVQIASETQALGQQFADLSLPSAMPDYGRQVAPTPCRVVWQNEHAQMVVYPGGHTPVLWVPAIINKHYILDLTEKRSVIQRMQAAGCQVFCMVWRNPQANPSVDDYLESITAALSKLAKPVHLAGYCLGGVLASAVVARGAQVMSLTSVASPLDGQMGELAAWLTPLQQEHMQRCADQRGCIPSGVLSAGFLSLKPESWGGLFHAARAPDLATWLLDGLDVSPAMWEWICKVVYAPGGAINAYGLERLTVPIWNQVFDQDHLVSPASFETQLGVLNSRAPGGHNGGLLREGWLKPWINWLANADPIELPSVEAPRDDLSYSALAL